MTPEQAAALREPFKPEQIGFLPKGGKLLDFVGHGFVTDRLLQVDPDWTWEPFALDERGLPALDEKGNLWIRLTVCGLTRIGVGEGVGMKERISDALKIAAARFGVALDMWCHTNPDRQEEPSYEDHSEPTVPMTASQQSEIARLSADLEPGQKGDLNNWYRGQGFPAKKSHLTKDQADEVVFKLNELIAQAAAERQPVDA